MRITTDDLFLLDGVSEENKKSFLNDSRIYTKKYKNGDVIYDTNDSPCCLGFILSGSVRAEKKSENKRVPMRLIKAGEVFGAASLFGAGDGYVTVITAKENTEVLFMPQECVASLIEHDGKEAVNYVRFLSERVRFLNSRIDFYTASDSTEKLFEYLCKVKDENGVAPMPSNRAQLAKQLDMGRASLYRAFNSLIEQGRIVQNEKGYKIILQGDITK